MKRRPPAQLSYRKQPQQARSAELVATILEAAIQVLAREGAQRFTTIRVAEKAGVSVGSLYQYFPNKAAILFRLQSDEWHQTSTMVSGILDETEQPPAARLRSVVQAFLRSECEEARTRVALDDAAPLYRDSPEAKRAHERGKRAFDTFLQETLPGVPAGARRVAANLLKTTLTAAGKSFSETPRTPAQIEAYAGAMGDMFCAYLAALPSGPSRGVFR